MSYPQNETILSLFIGLPREIGTKNLHTSMRKDLVESVSIKKGHIEGDEVADHKFHGGPDRVVHHYSLKNYEHLKSRFPHCAEKFKAGSYGENIYSESITERDLCIGDVFKLGSSLLQVSEPRRPCGTIDRCFEEEGLLKEILNSHKWGWFYRVLEEGTVKRGDQLIFVDRNTPSLNIEKLIRSFSSPQENVSLLKEAMECSSLSANFRKNIKKKLTKINEI